MTSIVRGATVYFVANFYDVDGDLTDPAAATLTIRHHINGAKTDALVTMSGSGGTWTATWESNNVDPGVIYWFIQSSGAAAAVQEGKFTLTANPAN